MNRVDQAFADARAANRGVLIPYVCPYDPEPGALTRLIPELADAGAGVIEVGIPYSDPIADGPVIAAAMHRALERGATPEGVFEQIASVRDRVSCGLVAMCSVSLAHAAGIDAFIESAKSAGFDGFIFPDAPVDESDALIRASSDAGMTCSLLVSPTTAPERAARIARACTGFVYLLARAGITGERREAPEIAERVQALREPTETPIAAGFGISSHDHVHSVIEHADGAIVGSALIRRLHETHESGGDAISEAAAFVRELATGLDR